MDEHVGRTDTGSDYVDLTGTQNSKGQIALETVVS